MEDNLAEDSPVEDILVEDNLAEDSLVEDNLVEGTPVEDSLENHHDSLVECTLVAFEEKGSQP